MPFPAYGSSVPSLAVNGAYFQGISFGDLASTSNYQLVSMQGIDLAGIASNDSQRPLQGGEFAGIDTPQGRDIFMNFNIRGATAAALDANRLALMAAFQSTGRTEYPLYFRTAGGTTYACMARIRKFVAPVDIESILARTVRASVAFHATDWRLYATPTKQATHTFTGTAGAASCAVGGLAYASPIISILAGSGVCQPIILAGAGNSIFDLEFGYITMQPGDLLTIDTDYQTALWTPSGGGTPTKALYGLVWPATWGALPANTTTAVSAIDESGSGATHTLTVQWADAFPGV